MPIDIDKIRNYTPLYYAEHQPRYLRREFLEAINKAFRTYSITYISPNAPISAEDSIYIEEVIYHLGKKINSLSLILYSPGGDPDAAEKIVEILRGRAKKFYVILPDRAKSAATMISIGANKIFMTENAELGPIDPQIRLKTPSGDIWRPAQSIIDGVALLLNQKEPTPALAYLLQHIDPATLDFAFKAIERSENIAKTFLRKYMLKENPELADSIAKKLADAREYLSHGKPITWKDAKDLGLKVELLKNKTKRQELIWRYFLFSLYDMQQKGANKLFESIEVTRFA